MRNVFLSSIVVRMLRRSHVDPHWTRIGPGTRGSMPQELCDTRRNRTKPRVSNTGILLKTSNLRFASARTRMDPDVPHSRYLSRKQHFLFDLQETRTECVQNCKTRAIVQYWHSMATQNTQASLRFRSSLTGSVRVLRGFHAKHLQQDSCMQDRDALAPKH